MRIIVQKFGGTSVATVEARAAVVQKIKEALDKGYHSIVVASAMGRNGDPYATDTLINLAKSQNPDITKRELDAIMCCGELISCSVLAGVLQKAGIKSLVLTGGQAGMITDNTFGAARIVRVETEHLRELLNDGFTPVVCGFQGVTEDNTAFTTIGRGGSDTSAAAIGAAINADLVEIYTDVEGIMTTDPRIVPEAQVLDTISYGEICQLAHQGAKVIHPRAVEIVMQKNIPMVVRSTFSDAPGTMITSDTRGTTGEFVVDDRVASGVSAIKDIAQIRISIAHEDQSTSLKVFDRLAQNSISVDCLNVHPGEIIFTVATSDLDKALLLLKEDSLNPSHINNCAKVSVVGDGMKGVTGVMSTFINALSCKNIAILQTVDSMNTISAVVSGDRTNDAVQALHEAFNLARIIRR